jgi:moderate conductance mechanosensitive channel
MNDATKDTNTYIAYLSDHLISILIIIAAAWLARHFGRVIISRIIKQTVRKTKLNEVSDDDVKKRQDTLIALLSAIWKWLVIIITFLLLLRVFLPAIDFTPMFASAGIIGIALGFGAQSLIKDFLTGIFIISENQYRVGDIVDIEGAAGTVERVGIRSTVLRDADGNVHYMPNGNVMHVINKTMGFSKVNFSLSVDPDTDIDMLVGVIDSVGQTLADDDKWKLKVLEAPHFLSVGTMSGSSVDVTIVGKTAPSAQWSVTSEMRRRLIEALHKSNIKLAIIPNQFNQAPPSKKR